MGYERPRDLFDREREWTQLTEFAAQSSPGLRIGVVSGRRRQGKSYMLRRLSRSAEGFYHQAQEVESAQALARFAGDVAQALGLPRDQLRFENWETALRTALGYPSRGSDRARPSSPAGPERLIVLDEFPYLLTHSPELPSVLQELHDEARDGDYPPAAVIVCGSALSVMADLLSGTKPLRGRAQLDLTVHPFDYRLAARYWGITDPRLAFMVHTVFGGTAGYKSLVQEPLPDSPDDLPRWLAGNVLNPAHALFNEKDYLLREDLRIADKHIYNSIMSSVASGRHSPKEIGGPLGRDANTLRHPLGVLVDAGFLVKVEDVLSRRRPLYFLADPIVRFAETVVDPYRPLLEEGDVAHAWQQARVAYSAQVSGPHFEHLAREWTRRFSGDRWGTRIGEVGPAVLNDPAGRTQHELDVVALALGDKRGAAGGRVVVLGEAKATKERRTVVDLNRLMRMRDLLARRGANVDEVNLALFSRDGFDDELNAVASPRDDVHLITIEDLYDS